MGRVKKYVKKQAKRAFGYAKKRYAPAGRVDIAKIASDVMKLKGLINSELKFNEVRNAPYTLPTQGAAWNITLLNGLVAQDGADRAEREGMSVRFKSLQLRGRLAMNVPTATTPRRCRVIIFIDKTPLTSGLGNDPVVTDLLDGALTSVGHVNSMRSLDSIHSKRFTVLSDRIYVFEDDKPEHLIKYYKKLDMVTTFQDGYTAADSINKNAIYMAMLTDVPTGSTETIQTDWITRMTYRDN